MGGGLLEETGWTRLAVPELRRRHSILSTGLIVGILCGIWQFMIAFWASDYLRGADSWLMFMAGFLSFYLVALPAYRVLLVWVFDRAGGNLPVIILMHAFFSASALIFQPSAARATSFIWNSGLGPVMWVVVAIVAVKNRGLLLKKPDS